MARSAGSTGWRMRACSSAWSAATGPLSRRSGRWPSTTPLRPTTCRSDASLAFIARSRRAVPAFCPRWAWRGLVIAQVERIAAAESLSPREVQISGVLVDCVVVAEPENHRQTYATAYNHAFSGRQRVPLDRVTPALTTHQKFLRPGILM